MDVSTPAQGRRIASLLCLIVSVALIGTARLVPGLGVDRVLAAPTPSIQGGDLDQRRTVEWALQRFGASGLDPLPSLEVHLHGARDACGGHLGFYENGRLDLCTAESSPGYARKFALHEMAHAWTESHLEPEVQAAFMRLRGIETWNDWSLPWKERGFEQAAEIVAWGLGEGSIQPQLPESPDARELAEAYELLTGRQPITPAA